MIRASIREIACCVNILLVKFTGSFVLEASVFVGFMRNDKHLCVYVCVC